MWLSEPFTRAQAWVDLIMLANHKPTTIYKRGIKIDIKVGEVAWSEVALGERWRWSRGKIRRYLKELETVQQIVQQRNYTLSRIIIVNYPKYQTNGTADSTADSTNDNKGENDKKQLSDKSLENMKKNKMGRYQEDGHNNYETSIDIDSGEEIADEFDETEKVNKKVTELIDWAEGVRGKPFMDKPTQRKFIHDLRKQDIHPDVIKSTYVELLGSEYWRSQTTLPDFKTVFSTLKNKK